MPTLTIGMPVYDDFEGLLWTVESLGLHHSEAADAELVVVDNHPDSPDGQQTAAFLAGWVGNLFRGGVKYVPVPTPVSPALSKSRVVTQAAGEIVLCLDCHVLLAPGALAALLGWYRTRPDFEGLLHGPLLYNNLQPAATHFADVWRGEMWGIWATAWRCSCGATHFDVSERGGFCKFHRLELGRPEVTGCPACQLQLPWSLPWTGHESGLESLGCRFLGADPNGSPFEIPGNGMGLFACRRDAWLGFSPHVRGFGGEEMVIHERYRQAGRQTLCLPGLQWWHRFSRKSVPYPLTRWAKVRNYVVEFQALGRPLDPIKTHFVEAGLLSASDWEYLLADPVGHETPPPAATPASTCGGCQAGTMPDTLTLEAWYEQARKTPGDVNEHMPKLRELASQCESVTEFGTRLAVSTVALLAAEPARLTSYDLVPSTTAAELTKRQGKTAFTFTVADVLVMPPIAETDLLFIDTKHTAAQLQGELTRHAGQVRRWIALHDTVIFGERGEDGGPGLLVALREFLRANPVWSVVYHTAQQHGLTVISRDPADKRPLPSLTKMAWNYTKAIATHLATGAKLADEPTIGQRLDGCATCDQRTENRCAVCGCYLDEAPDGRAGKAVWADSVCPLGKWSS